MLTFIRQYTTWNMITESEASIGTFQVELRVSMA